MGSLTFPFGVYKYRGEPNISCSRYKKNKRLKKKVFSSSKQIAASLLQPCCSSAETQLIFEKWKSKNEFGLEKTFI